MIGALKGFYSRWSVGSLLSSNTKLDKVPGSEQRYLVRGLSLAPHMQAGKNVCPWAGACVAACVLWFAGRTVMRNVRDAMIARTRWFHGDRDTFLIALIEEVRALVRAADRAGAVPVVRLNVASDVVWERVAPVLFTMFPGVRWYDYTKAPFRSRPTLPANYTLVHSFHERTTLADVSAALAAGRNVAVVFDTHYNPRAKSGRYGALPGVVHFVDGSGACVSARVVDGDAHDVRLPELDGQAVVIGLRGKGGRARVEEAALAGFVQRGGRRVADRADGLPFVADLVSVTVSCAG